MYVFCKKKTYIFVLLEYNFFVILSWHSSEKEIISSYYGT
jgi:hypothetical protein